MVRTPLIDMPRLDSRGDRAHPDLSLGIRRQKPAVPLFALVLTELFHVERRAWQRKTWLTFGWHLLSSRAPNGDVVKELGNGLVPWQYVYAMPLLSTGNRSQTAHTGEIMGDMVALAHSPRGDRPFSQRALQWALAHVAFEVRRALIDECVRQVSEAVAHLRIVQPEAKHDVVVDRLHSEARREAPIVDGGIRAHDKLSDGA